MEPGGGGVVSEANAALFEASLVNDEEDGDGVPSSQTEKEDAPPQETVPQMLARHQKDKKELQNKELALKKAAAKGSKAEQKVKKKQVEEDVVKLQAKMEARHLKELASVGYTGGGDDKHTDGLEALAKAMAGVSTGSVATQSLKVSKGQKWKEKRAQQEAKRELKIQEEQTNVVSDRSVENQLLERKLRPLRLTLKEIKPDGHCLYRAVEHQLSLLHPSPPQYSFQQLREIAAAYMRENSKEFIPFVASECEDSEEPKERFESYCKEVELTAAWGGELELRALAHALGKHIVVLSGDLPDVEMGKEYEASGSASQTLRLSYHRHAFGLGEHYNSVMPLL